MAQDLRLMGQEVSIRVVQAGAVLATLNAIATFNDNVKNEITEDDFLGENTTRVDNVHGGIAGDFEFQVNDATYLNFIEATVRKAKREDVTLVFNIVRIDKFANGSTATYVYPAVAWGEFPTTIGGRKEKVKIKASFACEERQVSVNALP